MSKVDYQKVKIIDVTGRGRKGKFEIGRNFMVSDDTSQAWEIDYNQQSRDPNGSLVQFISTLNKKPLQVFDDRSSIPGTSILSIAKQEFRATLVEIEEEHQKKSMLLWLGIIILSLLFVILLIVLLSMG